MDKPSSYLGNKISQIVTNDHPSDCLIIAKRKSFLYNEMDDLAVTTLIKKSNAALLKFDIMKVCPSRCDDL